MQSNCIQSKENPIWKLKNKLNCLEALAQVLHISILFGSELRLGKSGYHFMYIPIMSIFVCLDIRSGNWDTLSCFCGDCFLSRLKTALFKVKIIGSNSRFRVSFIIMSQEVKCRKKPAGFPVSIATASKFVSINFWVHIFCTCHKEIKSRRTKSYWISHWR